MARLPVARLPCGEVTGDSPIFRWNQQHFNYILVLVARFSAILHLNCIGKHIGLCLNLDSVLTTLNTNTETNTAIHSSQFDSVGRNRHLLAALPCQK